MTRNTKITILVTIGIIAAYSAGSFIYSKILDKRMNEYAERIYSEGITY